MKKLNVLICSGGKRVDLINEFKSAVKEKGNVFITDSSSLNAGMYFADGFFESPKISDKSYIPFLCGIIKKCEISLVFSVIDPELLLLAKNKDELEKFGATVLVSPVPSVEIANDKRKTSQFFNSIGVLTPKIYQLEQVTKFPVFIKPYDGSGSKFAFRVDSRSELDVFYSIVPNPLILEFISGQEYTIDCLCDLRGKILNIIPRKRLEINNGIAVKSIVDLDPEIIADTKKILASAQAKGPVTIQLIKMGEKNYFTELNLRFGGGVMLGIMSGGNFATKIIGMLEGKTYQFANDSVKNEYTMVAFLSHKFGYGQQKIKAIVFDLDDTIYPEKSFQDSAFNFIAKKLRNSGYKIGSNTIKKYHDKYPKNTFDELIKDFNLRFKINDLLLWYRTHPPKISPYPGIPELLKKLKEKFRLGILTDYDHRTQANKIKALKIRDFFDIILYTDQLRAGKPSTKGFEILRKKLGCGRNEVVYVGDNELKDFVGAKKSGFLTIKYRNNRGYYRNAKAPRSHKAHFEISRFNQITEILKKINK